MEVAASAASNAADVGGSAENALLDVHVDGSGQEPANVVTWLLVVCFFACLFKFRWLCKIQPPAEGRRLWGIIGIPKGKVWECRRQNGTVKQTIRGPENIFAFRLKLSQAAQAEGPQQNHYCPEAGKLGRACESGGCGGAKGCRSLEAQAPGQLSLSTDNMTTMLQPVQTSCTERFAVGANPCE